MSKELVKKVRFVQKKILPKSAATLRGEQLTTEFVRLCLGKEHLILN